MPKKALVLSGGGSRGAYQVGAIKHLLRDRKIHYDIIAGISVGALNGAKIAMFGPEQEVEASVALSALWNRVNDDMIYKKWWFRHLASLWRPSVYNSKPLQKTVDEGLDIDRLRASGKEFVVGAVSMTSGRYRTWTQEDDDIKKAVMASSAFPGMFLPVEIDGEGWVDGGLREVSPVADAIKAGATHLDIIVNHPQKLARFDASSCAVKSLPRIIEIMTSETTTNDLKQVELYNRLVACGEAPGKRHVEVNVLEPNEVLIENALDFNQDMIQKNIEKGYRDALMMDW